VRPDSERIELGSAVLFNMLRDVERRLNRLTLITVVGFMALGSEKLIAWLI
jgi:hypothetical protein